MVKSDIKVAVLENVYYLCDEGLKKGKRFTRGNDRHVRLFR